MNLGLTVKRVLQRLREITPTENLPLNWQDVCSPLSMTSAHEVRRRLTCPAVDGLLRLKLLNYYWYFTDWGKKVSRKFFFTLQRTETQDLPVDCWPRLHMSTGRGERSLREFTLTCGQHIESPDAVCFLHHYFSSSTHYSAMSSLTSISVCMEPLFTNSSVPKTTASCNLSFWFPNWSFIFRFIFHNFEFHPIVLHNRYVPSLLQYI
jgi:hypothetical protein